MPSQKITDKIAALAPGATFHSLEFFPPKTDEGFQNLVARLERMSLALRPLFINITWGAGGSTASKSLQLAEICQRQLRLTTCLHLTCTNMSQSLIDEALEAAKSYGIRNILALRGDPPRKDEYGEPRTNGDKETDVEGREFVWAADLVRYIRQKHGSYFCVGVAAYPDGYGEGQYSPEQQDVKKDLPYLIEKTAAGADFIMTQLFFDISKYLEFEKILYEESTGTFKSIPIIPGLMPIQSYDIVRRVTKLAHATVPKDIQNQLDELRGDDAKVKETGIEILSGMIEKIQQTPSPQRRGYHFYTLNLEKAVSYILERCNLIPPDSDAAVIEFDDTACPDLLVPERRRDRRDRRASSAADDPRNHVIVDNIDGRLDASKLTSASDAGFLIGADEIRPEVTLQISEGEGTLGREATWDDFPNGRFGDARSPAFGEIDGYGPTLHMSAAQAVKFWGYPVTTADISALFIKHIKGELAAIPWSEEALNEESKLIRKQLIKLNERGWWTVASQPAVNAAKSDDDIFGWGPKRGYVFQKGFVEFFVSTEEWVRLKEKLNQYKHDEVGFYARRSNGEFESNFGEKEEGLNAVTWGVFTGKEIITPTIIEAISFKAWAEEAFAIWDEWSKSYKPKSRTSTLLSDIGNNYWLVNIVHHDFPNEEALWEILDVA